MSAPTNAAIDANSGIFTWRPAVAQADTTNLVSIQAANNATPGLSATQSFYVTVRPLNSPTVSGIFVTNNQISVTVGGDSGPDYLIQVSTNLIQWQKRFHKSLADAAVQLDGQQRGQSKPGFIDSPTP